MTVSEIEPWDSPAPEAGDDTTSIRVRRALDGSMADLDWIVARFSPMLRAQASYRLGTRISQRVDIDDVVAEVWLAALRRRSDIVPKGGRYTPVLAAFLGSTLLNIINHRLRSLARHRWEVQPPEPSTTSAPDFFAGRSAADVTSAIAHAAASEIGTLISATLASLPGPDRDVIILRGVEGLSNDEAAEELGILPNTVSQRYRRSLQHLRTALPRSLFDEFEDD